MDELICVTLFQSFYVIDEKRMDQYLAFFNPIVFSLMEKMNLCVELVYLNNDVLHLDLILFDSNSMMFDNQHRNYHSL